MVAVQNVVIAGGGIVGNSISYFLAQRNIPCTIIDPVGIAPGASGKAGGFLARDWRDDTPIEQLHRLGFELHQELAKEFATGTDENHNLVDYRRLTCAHVSIDESKWGQNPQKVRGVEWADQGVRGSASMGEEDAIAQVHPRKLCEQLWAYSSKKVGSKLHIGRVVKAILDPEAGNAVRGVQLEDGTTIEATQLVVACGPWSSEARSWFSDAKGIPNSKNAFGRVTGSKCHSILVQNPKRILKQAVFFDSRGVLGGANLEVYPRPDGDCYVCGFGGNEEIIKERPGQESVDDRTAQRLQDALQSTSSELKDLSAHTRQACYWPGTADGLPMIGPIPNVPGAYIAAGHNVWGILQGPATGKAMSELLLDGKSSCVDLSPFEVGRFRY